MTGIGGHFYPLKCTTFLVFMLQTSHKCAFSHLCRFLTLMSLTDRGKTEMKATAYKVRRLFSNLICAKEERNGPVIAHCSLSTRHSHVFFMHPVSESTNLSLSHSFCELVLFTRVTLEADNDASVAVKGLRLSYGHGLSTFSWQLICGSCKSSLSNITLTSNLLRKSGASSG